MASIDYKGSSAYYSVSVDKNKWNTQFFQFTCLPNGLSSAPRIFTKLMKPAYSVLRCKGEIYCKCGIYSIDDTHLKGRTFHDCKTNKATTVKLFRDLDLTLNMGKSILIPTQRITFWGFLLNLVQMNVSQHQQRP